jgi:hypothetical protein
MCAHRLGVRIENSRSINHGGPVLLDLHHRNKGLRLGPT